MSIKDKIVIVTGAGSGIGAATAKLLAREGAVVVLSDINEEMGMDMVKEIVKEGGKADFKKANVAKYDEVDDLINYTVDLYDQLDVIVNNAGIGNQKMQKTSMHDIDEWHRVLAVNQTGVFYCMKAALKQMETQGHGNIVNVASLAGLKAAGKMLAYSASKFAVVGMTKSAALEYARKNIRINCVCPGYTQSALLDQVFSNHEGMDQKLLNFMPMGRFGKADEIAESILWLASDKSSFVTGHALSIDGGSGL